MYSLLKKRDEYISYLKYTKYMTLLQKYRILQYKKKIQDIIGNTGLLRTP